MSGERETLSYVDALRRSMHRAMADHDNTVVMGQGVTDFKGIFGSTTGFVEEFGEHRVIETPLMEEGMTGVALGAALNGLYPIMTHIRADFVLLAANQIINLAAKYRYMFGGLYSTPMLIRVVIGRSWGQGAQHSQSLQSLFAHIPGLQVIMPSSAGAVLDSYEEVTRDQRGPVVSFEHRLLYPLLFDPAEEAEPIDGPLGMRRVRSGKDVTIVATSIMVLEAKRAAQWLSREAGIEAEVLDLHSLTPIDPEPIIESLSRTGRLLIADTSWLPFGTAAEICRLVTMRDPSLLKAPVAMLGMADAPCPTAKALEDLYYPHLGDLVDRAARLVTGRDDHGVPLPDERSMADVYKSFKGPF